MTVVDKVADLIDMKHGTMEFVPVLLACLHNYTIQTKSVLERPRMQDLGSRSALAAKVRIMGWEVFEVSLSMCRVNYGVVYRALFVACLVDWLSSKDRACLRQSRVICCQLVLTMAIFLEMVSRTVPF